MAYDDTKWGGFAKIIVDTATMTAGDKVRVRSMTDANAIYDKTVVTPGTPLVWDSEIFKDYVKICTVQTISNVETEIGGVYKSVDYGQTLFINVLDKTSLAGIQGILNAHQEAALLSIGDEVTITYNNAPYTVQIAEIDYRGHDVVFVSKNFKDNTKVKWNSSSTDNKDFATSTIGDLCDSFYQGISNSDQAFIKDFSSYSACKGSPYYKSFTKKVWIPSSMEVFGIYGNDTHTAPETQSQFSIFATANGRIRSADGETAGNWWTRDGNGGEYAGNIWITQTGGTRSNSAMNSEQYFLPCFWMTANA